MARVFQLKPSASPSRLGIDYASTLNDEQRAVVMARRGPLLVLAGAGSGKTRALTYRVARFIDEGIAAERVLLLTFTNRAAKAMLQRVAALVGPQSLRVMGGTFHHVGNSILRAHAQAIGYAPNFTILDREDCTSMMDAALASVKIDIKKERFPAADVLLDVASFTLNTQEPARDVLYKKAPRFAHMADDIVKVLQAFVHKKVERNVMDFDDLLMNWKVLLEEGGAVAERIRNAYDAVLVDEYQDTNALQGQIVDLMAQGHKNVTAVGDDAQCIYKFRGADPSNMRGFAERYPAATTLPLAVNYRSTPEILSIANAVLSRAREGFKTRLIAVRPEGVLPALVPTRDTHQQAEFTAARILELRDEGVQLKDIAILYRAHRNALELQVELTRRGIPFVVRSGLRFFEQAHIKDVLAFLKLIYNPDDELSFRRAIRLMDGVGNATADALWSQFRAHVSHHMVPAEALARVVREPHLGDVLQRRAKPGVEKFAALIGSMTARDVAGKPGEMLRVLLDEFYGAYVVRMLPNGAERKAEIEELADFAGGFADLEAFLSELALVQNFSAEEVVSAEDPDERVTLSSIHQAKGLEWSRVFLVWLSEGTFPSDLALKEDGGEDEERRLFYVGVTRAKDELYLVHPQITRARDHSMVLHKHSRFIEELPKPTTHSGREVGVYEQWQIEITDAPQLPALCAGHDGPPTTAEMTQAHDADAHDHAALLDGADDAAERYEN